MATPAAKSFLGKTADVTRHTLTRNATIQRSIPNIRLLSAAAPEPATQNIDGTTDDKNIKNAPNTTSNNNQQQETKPLKSYLSGPTTHFGYQSVFATEKESRVRRVFENVADNYDVMNDLMSGGLHRYWKDELLKMTGVGPMAKVVRRRASMSYGLDGSAKGKGNNETQPAQEPLLSILDVAGGTGDIAFRFLESAKCVERAKSSGHDEITITVCDINPEMLRVGESRARSLYGHDVIDESKALTFVEGNAQSLPFGENKFDLYTIAFGLRNVTDVDVALRDAYRVLKPGGRFLCLEFSRVKVPVLAEVYDAYSFHVIPAIGEFVAKDRDSYQYLVESIRKFCTQEELVGRMEAAGFEGVKFTNMTGGIVAVHEGWKPL